MMEVIDVEYAQQMFQCGECLIVAAMCKCAVSIFKELLETLLSFDTSAVYSVCKEVAKQAM